MSIKEAAILCIFIAAGIVDIRKREFPVWCQAMLLLLYPIQFHIKYLWGAVFAIPFFVASLKTNKMGMGDSKAVLLLGGLIGLEKMFVVTVTACVSFILCGFSLTKGKDERSFPFVPFVALGYGLTMMMMEVFQI